MKHKTIQQLRDTLNKVLKRGRPNQLKKLQKAYHGKRLKMWWASYAQFENLQISELKEMEGVGNRMKGGHRRNAIYNAFHRIIFRSKNARQIDPTQKQEWRKIFEIQVFGELKRIAQINFLDILKKGKHFKQSKRITEASNER
jgi:hypothetical protein